MGIGVLYKKSIKKTKKVCWPRCFFLNWQVVSDTVPLYIRIKYKLFTLMWSKGLFRVSNGAFVCWEFFKHIVIFNIKTTRYASYDKTFFSRTVFFFLIMSYITNIYRYQNGHETREQKRSRSNQITFKIRTTEFGFAAGGIFAHGLDVTGRPRENHHDAYTVSSPYQEQCWFSIRLNAVERPKERSTNGERSYTQNTPRTSCHEVSDGACRLFRDPARRRVRS